MEIRDIPVTKLSYSYNEILLTEPAPGDSHKNIITYQLIDTGIILKVIYLFLITKCDLYFW